MLPAEGYLLRIFIGEGDVRSIRPGYGLPPKELPKVIGKRAARDLKRGEPVDWEILR